MENFQFVIIRVLMILKLRCVEAQYTTVPRNTAGLSGQALTLNCAKNTSVPDQVAWKEFISDPSGSLMSVDNTVMHTYRDRYNVLTASVGTYNLQVRALSEREAGNHQCGIGIVHERFATVIQLTQPMCNVTPVAAENDTVTATCETTFTGRSAWAPQMNWTFNSNTLPATNESSGQLAKYTTNFTVAQDMHGQQFSCLTYFNVPPKALIPSDTSTKVYDRRAPLFTYQCLTNSIVVQYGPRDLKITPITSGDILIPGDQITCSAMGKPTPSYRWFQVQGAGTQTTIDNRVLTITIDMKGYNTYICLATNILVGDREKNITSNISFFVDDVRQTTYSNEESVTTEILTTSNELPSSDQQASVGIGPGGIAAIVLGLLMLMQTTAFISYCLYTRKIVSKRVVPTVKSMDPK